MERDACLVLVARYSAERGDLLDIAATAIQDASYLDSATLARLGAAARDLDTLMVARDAELSSNCRTIGQLQELLEVAHQELLDERDEHQATTTDLEAALADLHDERRAHADSRLELVAARDRLQATTDLLTAERAETVRLRGHAARLSGENAQLRLTAAMDAVTGIGHRATEGVADGLNININIDIDSEEADRSRRDMNHWLLEWQRSETASALECDYRAQGRDFTEEFTDVDECGFNFTAVDEALEPDHPQTTSIIPEALDSFGGEPWP
jgi:hypothetical protein